MSASLVETAHALVGAGKGLLAMDESNATCDKRFAAVGIPQTVDMRRAYRELLVTTEGLDDCISGAILYDETIRQTDRQGRRLVDRLTDVGIIPGIKVDTGAKKLALHPGETITEGLDGLRDRLSAYRIMGARFAKWRAVIGLQDSQPTFGCIRANMQALARYAALCQEAGIVPIVEPDVLMTGDHTMERCFVATENVLEILFEELTAQSVKLEGVILKPNMVLPGLACPIQEPVADVAAATLRCLLRSVPAAVAGIAFLSGGQSARLATARLNAIALRAVPERAPWKLVFSFARAIQQPALDLWHGAETKVRAAQHVLHHRAWCNHAALGGTYSAVMEDDPAYLRAS